jgi:uncharacterized membrane protein YhaH (DUF805 family)
MVTGFDLKTFLLSPKGQVAPSPFFSFFAIVAMYSAVLSFAAGVIGPSSIVAIFTVIVFVVTAWSRYCVMVKRLRDAGWPLPWTLVQFVPDILSVLTYATGLAWLAIATQVLTLGVLVLLLGLIVTPGAKPRHEN